jgi:GTP-binding protein HflX
MKRIFGNTSGLKSSHIRKLENFYRRRVQPYFLISPELAKDICRLSKETGRQTGLLIDRLGKITHVIIGDHQSIMIPGLQDYRSDPGRLLGLRCIHTHLGTETLTRDDLTDLALLRLDMMAAITVEHDGLPGRVHTAHILPGHSDDLPYRILEALKPDQLDIDCRAQIRALETEMAQNRTVIAAGDTRERALLVSVTTKPRRQALDSMDELRELARTSSIVVLDTVIQQRKKVNPRFLMGIGKLQEIALLALQKAATLIVFDQDLNPSQIRSITGKLDIKVLDRTQLILDIFAQRAISREGKLQVELAQLKYLLPRLVTKDTAMSRLTGGIGGRGPGETKLEINRRRAHSRIARLEKAVKQVRKQRTQQKARRNKKGLPVISIIGYTNAGKSTLLNTLTNSTVLAENQLFATLDPSSRRLRFPRDLEVIITDTVGFIRDLPKDLVVAFRATLEELESADLLLHVIDISNPRYKAQIASVEKITADLKLGHIPCIPVLNKMDRVDAKALATLSTRLNGIPISALDRTSLIPLIDQVIKTISTSRITGAGRLGS